jgi:hypothetical protein
MRNPRLSLGDQLIFALWLTIRERLISARNDGLSVMSSLLIGQVDTAALGGSVLKITNQVLCRFVTKLKWLHPITL